MITTVKVLFIYPVKAEGAQLSCYRDEYSLPEWGRELALLPLGALLPICTLKV